MRFKTLAVVALVALCGGMLVFISAPRAQAASYIPTHQQSRVVTKIYSPSGEFMADGVVHQFRYDILCANGAAGCYVLVTFSAKVIAPPQGAKTLPGVVLGHQYMPGRYTNTFIEITNDYKTCTGWFGSCGDYTEADLVSDDWYNGSISGNYDNIQSCGAHNWICEGVGPTSNNFNQCSGCVQNIYGPQLYNSSDGQNSQTKYSKILLHPNGQYTLQYSCVGSLC